MRDGLPDDSKNAFDEIMEFRSASDKDKIENMHKYFWMIDLFDDINESPEVREAYEQYRKMKEL